jgi:hypothetical protein
VKSRYYTGLKRKTKINADDNDFAFDDEFFDEGSEDFAIAA